MPSITFQLKDIAGHEAMNSLIAWTFAFGLFVGHLASPVPERRPPKKHPRKRIWFHSFYAHPLCANDLVTISAPF
jgi:hypothetical protein